MKFLVLVKATEKSEAGVMPTEAELAAMTTFNEQLVKSGILLDGAGLHPSSKGVRIAFDGDRRTVIDGPFSETKELVAGYWLIDVKSREEAIEWIKRVPNPSGEMGTVELRPLFDITDFTDMSADTLARNQAMMDQGVLQKQR